MARSTAASTEVFMWMVSLTRVSPLLVEQLLLSQPPGPQVRHLPSRLDELPQRTGPEPLVRMPADHLPLPLRLMDQCVDLGGPGEVGGGDLGQVQVRAAYRRLDPAQQHVVVAQDLVLQAVQVRQPGA